MEILITYYRNPIDPLSRVTERVEGDTVYDIVKHLEYDDALYEMVVSVNNVIITDWYNYKLCPVDIVAIQLLPNGGGGGKNILRTIALVAVAVAAPYAAAGIIGGGMTAATLGTWGSLLAGGLMVVGSTLVNAILPVQPTDMSSDFGSQSPTYGWNVNSNNIQIGTPVPKLFGRMRVFPKLISQYIQTINNKQYLNCLYAVNDGNIEALDSLEINDAPITNYDDVTYEVRYGDTRQDIILAFSKTWYVQELGFNLEHKGAPDYATTQTTTVSEIVLGFYFPSGIYETYQDSGDGEINHNAGAWQIYVVIEGINDSVGFLSEFNFRIKELSLAPYRTDYTINWLEGGEYRISCRAVHLEYNSDFDDNLQTVYWNFIQEAVDDEFTYPGTALLAIRALATDQLNGSEPRVSCIAQADGGWNPADIARMILNDCGIDVSSLTSTFDTWEDTCLEKDYAFDAYIDSFTTVSQLLAYVGIAGRAKVEQYGSRFTVIEDKAAIDPTQGFTFGMGNIKQDSFKERFLPIKDRASSLELTYYDADDNFKKKTVKVSNESVNTPYEENKHSQTLVGFTKTDKVLAYGKYALNWNTYATVEATWEANVDSLVCKTGDVVQVSHDRPLWGASGRIVSCSITECVLDREVTFEADKEYLLMVRSSVDNSISYHILVNTEDTTSTVIFESPLSQPFEIYENYSFGEDETITRLFRLTSIQTSGNDATRVLTGLEYNESIYDDHYEIWPVTIPEYGIYAIRASDYLKYFVDKKVDVRLSLMWQGVSLSYTVSLKHESELAYTNHVVYDTSFDISAKEGNYSIRISDRLGNTKTLEYEVLGKFKPPATVPYLLVENGRITWGVVRDIDIAGYRIKYVYGIGDDWGTANLLSQQLFVTSPVAIPANFFGEMTFFIKAVDTSGIESESATIKTFNLGDFDLNNVVFLYDEDNDDWPGTLAGYLDPNPKANNEGFLWSSNPNARLWSLNQEDLLWSNIFEELVYETNQVIIADTIQNRKIVLYFSCIGVGYKVEYKRVGTNLFWGLPTDPLWDANDSTLLWSDAEYLNWPGEIAALAGIYQFKITVVGGAVQGEIENLLLYITANDVIEYLDDVAIESTGTRLSLSKTYSMINTITPTIRSGTGRFVEIVDYDLAGPLIKIKDGSESYVSGTLDIIIKGYN